MDTFFLSLLILLIGITVFVNGTHFRGGIITWRALNTTPSGTSVKVLIHQRYSWRRTYWTSSARCTNTMIASQGYIGIGTGSLDCYSPSCGSSMPLSTDVTCTDFSSSAMDYSSGERYDIVILPLHGTFVVGFSDGNWLALAIGGNANWQVTAKIQLTVRPDSVINTSPVTSTLPVLYRTVNVQHIHIVQMADADTTDTLRCRWSTDNSGTPNFNNYDECYSVCSPSLSWFQLFPDNCTLVYKITALDYYAVALQIEDYYTSGSSTPMSSVPVQFLFYGVNAPTGCAVAPKIIGVRPNLACIGTPIGNLTNETVIVQVGCPGRTIVEFTTSSPIGLIKSAIQNPSTGIYTMSLLFTPTANQYGPQGFCAAAIDDADVQSDPWCITFLVGFTAPNLQPPVLVQGSASPIGTVFANQSIFSIQSKNGVPVNRPGHNGTNISFHDATLGGTTVLAYDCGWSPNVIYSGSTIIVNVPYAWVPGHQYYLTFDSGASSGNDFCHAESDPLTDPAFWRFDIWNPGLSSTTSTTTIPPTTHTVSTRPVSTTTPNANLTTTGIVVTNTTPFSPLISTTTTTSTTTVSTTSDSTTTVTTSLPDVSIMTPKDFEDACKQPVAIATAISMIIMLPIHIAGMYTLFTKMDLLFNPNRLKADLRRKTFVKRLNNK